MIAHLSRPPCPSAATRWGALRHTTGLHRGLDLNRQPASENLEYLASDGVRDQVLETTTAAMVQTTSSPVPEAIRSAYHRERSLSLGEPRHSDPPELTKANRLPDGPGQAWLCEIPRALVKPMPALA